MLERDIANGNVQAKDYGKGENELLAVRVERGAVFQQRVSKENLNPGFLAVVSIVTVVVLSLITK